MLTPYEENIAYGGALHPDDIQTSFADIGGNAQAISRLHQVTRILLGPAGGGKASPSQEGAVQSTRFFRAPSGVLLYGPPGCGKTMIARALAKESGVRFIAVDLATIMDKWLGETEKYIGAIFSLARKIAPVIIFIDEIDALTRRRRGGEDHEWSSGMKSQLLSYWDGLSYTPDQRILVLGATNRPQDIDEAFLRRMPLQIRIDLPSVEERTAILSLLLADVSIAPSHILAEGDGDVIPIDVALLGQITEGFSGSDLYEMARRTILHASLSEEGRPLEMASFVECIGELVLEKARCRSYDEHARPGTAGSR